MSSAPSRNHEQAQTDALTRLALLRGRAGAYGRIAFLLVFFGSLIAICIDDPARWRKFVVGALLTLVATLSIRAIFVFAKRDLDGPALHARLPNPMRIAVGALLLIVITVLIGRGHASIAALLFVAALAVEALLNLRALTGTVSRHGRVPKPWEIAIAMLVLVPLAGSVIFVTGGFDSPALPMLIPICFFIGTLSTRQGAIVLSVLTVVLIWVTAFVSAEGLIPDLMPRLFGGGPNVPQSATLLFTKAVSLTVIIVWTAGASILIRKLFLGIVDQALDARDEALLNHSEHERMLTALSGEIAHELKNPLASVKGLATLLEKDVEGKAAERLGVLRREVDRMEEILAGFLNFSRPLLPLQQEQVALRPVCDAVVELHEGVAGERSVELRVVEWQPIEVWCDPRKVKQIVINLVQNALEASPAGSEIELLLDQTGGSARLEVHDRGPGISASMRERLFEPGSTTKDKGSGLGLALARGLARQHGGELELHNGEGGGCVAVLTLPLRKTAGG